MRNEAWLDGSVTTVVAIERYRINGKSFYRSLEVATQRRWVLEADRRWMQSNRAAAATPVATQAIHCNPLSPSRIVNVMATVPINYSVCLSACPAFSRLRLSSYLCVMIRRQGTVARQPLPCQSHLAMWRWHLDDCERLMSKTIAVLYIDNIF